MTPVPAVVTVEAGGKQSLFKAGRVVGDLKFAGTVLHNPIVVDTTGGTRAGVMLLQNVKMTYHLDVHRVRVARKGDEPITFEQLRYLATRPGCSAGASYSKRPSCVKKGMCPRP